MLNKLEKLISKKLFIMTYAITGVLITCLLSYLDKGNNGGVYTSAIMAIGAIAGVHNWAQGRVDEKKGKVQDAT